MLFEPCSDLYDSVWGPVAKLQIAVLSIVEDTGCRVLDYCDLNTYVVMHTYIVVVSCFPTCCIGTIAQFNVKF